MSNWAGLEAAEPDFARRLKALFDAHVHKTMATLRRDGSPRISGTEVDFAAGDLWMGSMPGSVKARDLRRDARVALHSGSDDPPGWTGDAKLSGLAIEVTDPETVAIYRGSRQEAGHPTPEEPFHLFRVDIREAVITRLGEPPDHLVIESWREGEGLRSQRRD